MLPNVHYTKHAPLVADFSNLRSQCIFMLSEKVQGHKIASKVQGEDKEKMIEELSIYQDVTKDGGKRTATSKDDIKLLLGHSPDDSDTWIMRCYFEVRNKISPDQTEQQAQVRSKLADQFATRRHQISNSSTK